MRGGPRERKYDPPFFCFAQIFRPAFACIPMDKRQVLYAHRISIVVNEADRVDPVNGNVNEILIKLAAQTTFKIGTWVAGGFQLRCSA